MIVLYTYNFRGGREESRRLLKLAIAGVTGSAEEADSLVSSMTTSGDAGKPYIPGFDFFSISHSGSTWAVLISGSECGLDIQYPRKTGIEGIAGRFYAPEDCKAVMTALDSSAKDAEKVFFRIWARREALVKALGQSVASEGLPSVLNDKVQADNTGFIIRDIRLPGSSDLYVAICVKAGCDEVLPGELQFRELIQD